MANTTNTTNTAPKTDEKKEKLVKIKIPRMSRDEGDVYVGVNERSWLIKRGVEVEVPECVAEVLKHSEEMRDYAYEYSANKQSN